jgi:hypothetical protein
MRERILSILLIAFILAPFLGRTAPADAQPPQETPTACRAAQESAYRQLAERIKDLQVEPNVHVRNFAAESEEIAEALDTFIKRARVVDTRQLNDGSCEVTVELTIEQIEKELTQIAKEHYHGDKWQEHGFDNIHGYNPQKALTVTGVSARRPAEPEWVGQFIRATGSGVPPEEVKDPSQAKLLAERAAEADAKRNLLEKISDIQVDSTTYVRDYVAQHDEISTMLNSFLANLKRVDIATDQFKLHFEEKYVLCRVRQYPEPNSILFGTHYVFSERLFRSLLYALHISWTIPIMVLKPE